MAGADCVNYFDLLVICKVIDGKLDFPFPIYWFNCTADNKVYYDINDVPNNTEVLANIHVKTEDYNAAGKLPCVVNDFQNDPRVKAFWDVTESAEIAQVEPLDGKLIVEDLKATVSKLAPFCISNKMDTVSLVVDEPVILTEVKLNEKL